MVDIGVLNPHSASIPNGTPQLTINHDAIIDLDSSSAFEGPEKLLEVWFAPCEAALPTGCDGLKVVPANVWETMLDAVNCKVLSVVESDHVDAYLLSESSMFVFPHKLILKTCGTTTLLWGIPHLLRIAAEHAMFPSTNSENKEATPYRIFYSRKNFLFPDKQLHPHRSWADEMRYLDKTFAGGSAYMVGKMNGEHWYLYLTNAVTILTPPATPEGDRSVQVKRLGTSGVTIDSTEADEEDDETLEILMTDLDVENAKQFYLEHATETAQRNYVRRSDGGEVFSSSLASDGEFQFEGLPPELTTEGHALGAVVSESCGLSEIYPKSRYPDARIDAYQFTPCGFSANGVIPSNGHGPNKTHYFTVHVTPEPHCSYASFETNVPTGQSGRETAEIVAQIVNIFKPGRFSVTLFEKNTSSVSPSSSTHSLPSAAAISRAARLDSLAGYKRADRVRHDLDGYDLVYCHFERDTFAGSSPRIGEPLS